MTELRVVQERIAGLGQALQDPIDQQILWHLLSAERGGTLAPARQGMRAPRAEGGGNDRPARRLLHSGPHAVTPSLTANITRRPKPEIRIHYRHLHEQGLVERRHRVVRLGAVEHTYTLAPRLRPALEAISAFALPDAPYQPEDGQ
ncbi:MAG TPA: hypothetical protein VFK93_04035 [Candidatus Limnocylindria bacterium]|nr:hypothetical protein [Candidatus Limnocylindria bacterium]